VLKPIVRCSSKETVDATVREDNPGERSETTGGKICETGFKPGVKERGDYE